MRFVLFNFVDPEDATAYYELSPEEQQADVERHFEWFRTAPRPHRRRRGARRAGKVKTLRPGRQGEGVVVTDGPYVETKELLGGFVILETESEDEALAIAKEWPSLSSQANATVHLQPVFVRD